MKKTYFLFVSLFSLAVVCCAIFATNTFAADPTTSTCQFNDTDGNTPIGQMLENCKPTNTDGTPTVDTNGDYTITG